MRKVISGVTVITTLHEGRPWGMTVSAFTPVCMDPPTLLVCVNSETTTAKDIRREKHFGVNLLSKGQQHVSQLCATQGESKFLNDHVIAADLLPFPMTAPVIKDSLATFDCALTDAFVVGTHLVAIARVNAVLSEQPVVPLLYGQGRYHHGVLIEEPTALRAANA
ncbi:flavin reductase family protein [Methylobacterium sp. C1]|uniref:flavin reductase family protein n=1 Tax=Methylobacterium sp. C1 TaxID=1479019 RepID=UPI001331BCF6|nr:flavin reductase family protein [Methylobacterium sp. C1]